MWQLRSHLAPSAQSTPPPYHTRVAPTVLQSYRRHCTAPVIPIVHFGPCLSSLCYVIASHGRDGFGVGARLAMPLS